MPPATPTATAFAVLGAHRAPGPATGSVDAIDLVVRTDDGNAVLLGLRTGGYLDGPDGPTEHEPENWDGYTPLAVTLDRSAVRHWDFGRVLWIGPEPHPCLVWSNAVALSLTAVPHLLSGERAATLLAGPDGRGLPSPADLGVTVPAALTWHPLTG